MTLDDAKKLLVRAGSWCPVHGTCVTEQNSCQTPRGIGLDGKPIPCGRYAVGPGADVALANAADLAALRATLAAVRAESIALISAMDDTVTGLRATLAAVREEVAKPAPLPWRPADPPPDYDGLVGIRTADGAEATGCYDHDDHDGDGTVNPGLGWYHVGRRSYGHTDVTHWRPLPEPRDPLAVRVLAILDAKEPTP